MQSAERSWSCWLVLHNPDDGVCNEQSITKLLRRRGHKDARRMHVYPKRLVDEILRLSFENRSHIVIFKCRIHMQWKHYKLEMVFNFYDFTYGSFLFHRLLLFFNFLCLCKFMRMTVKLVLIKTVRKT